MKTRYVYLPVGRDPYLLECWLRARTMDERVWLISDHEDGPVIAAAHDCVSKCSVPNQDDSLPQELSSALVAAEDPTLLLPLAPDRIPMRYRCRTLMSDLAPHYGYLRRAWAWGFRELGFVTHQGEERVRLPYLLDAFHNRHRGQRCFVVGNGPSLGQLDMSRLKDEITLGSNRCFLGYEEWGYPFTYWGVYDKYQIETYHRVYESGVPEDTVKFFPVEYAPVMDVANGCPVNINWPGKVDRSFSANPDGVYVGFTVTYMLLQIAACMGCDPIVLIGADHRYELSRRGYSRAFRRLRRQITRRFRGGRVYDAALAAQRAWRKNAKVHAPSLWSTDDAANLTHFTSTYTDGGRNKFLPPEPEEAERDFDAAQAWAECNGVQILNATPGSALESFPHVDFDELF
jgi:hypothetical protein